MDKENIEIALYCAAAGVSTFCLAWLVVSSLQAARQRAVRLGEVKARPGADRVGPLGLFARSVGLIISSGLAKMDTLLGRDADKSLWAPLRLRIERALVAGGLSHRMTPDQVVGTVALGAAGGALAGAAVLLRVKIGLVVLAGAGIGAYLPVAWLRSQVNTRKKALRKLLPYAMDLLTLAVEAGLDFTEALARIVQKLGGTALADEMGLMLREIRFGKGRSQALRDMAQRVGVSELNAVVASLVQAEELGAALGPILRIQADQLRIRRSQAAEKQAMEAPVKILFPLIFFIFPTIFIIIFGPIFLEVIFQKF